jgi:hypothetical protein
MKYETDKPSEVIYAFLHAIATICTNIVKLIFGCLWLVGDRAVKLITSKSAKADSENS